MTTTPLDFAKHAMHDLPALDSDHSSPQPVSLLTLLRTPQLHPVTPTTPDSPIPILRRDSVSSADEHARALKFTVISPHTVAPPVMSEASGSSDGYEEDEEDGAFSDDEVYSTHIPTPAQFPFARPTNYDGSSTSPSAPPAPAILPPPSRRGRGHIRVVDGNDAPKSCSRHCSPPPARSRSGSECKSRTSDAGPRDGRAGSPMPDVSDLSDVDDEEDEGIPTTTRWRRASEHNPGFRRMDDRRPSGARLDETLAAGSTSGGDENVYHLLENSLASTNLTRARSMGARVSFKR